MQIVIFQQYFIVWINLEISEWRELTLENFQIHITKLPTWYFERKHLSFLGVNLPLFVLHCGIYNCSHVMSSLNTNTLDWQADVQDSPV